MTSQADISVEYLDHVNRDKPQNIIPNPFPLYHRKDRGGTRLLAPTHTDMTNTRSINTWADKNTRQIECRNEWALK